MKFNDEDMEKINELADTLVAKHSDSPTPLLIKYLVLDIKELKNKIVMLTENSSVTAENVGEDK